MNREQLIDFCAVALYDGWRGEENQRRREVRALNDATNASALKSGVMVLRSGPPFDLPPWGGIPESEREVFRARARPMVLALERENALRVGSECVYDVEIDDPDLAKAYRYDGIVAFNAQAAAWEGARRVLRDDPLDFLYRQQREAQKAMPFPGPLIGFPPPWDDRLTIENPTLIEAVAIYAKVRLTSSSAGSGPWLEGDALWLGYPT